MDDDRDFAEGPAQVTTARGHRPTKAATGEEAADKALGGDFDAVFMDVMLPGMCGLDTRRAIGDAKPSSRVVLMTAADAETFAPGARRGGARDIQRKLFDPVTLLRALERELGEPE